MSVHREKAAEVARITVLLTMVQEQALQVNNDLSKVIHKAQGRSTAFLENLRGLTWVLEYNLKSLQGRLPDDAAVYCVNLTELKAKLDGTSNKDPTGEYQKFGAVWREFQSIYAGTVKIGIRFRDVLDKYLKFHKPKKSITDPDFVEDVKSAMDLVEVNNLYRIDKKQEVQTPPPETDQAPSPHIFSSTPKGNTPEGFPIDEDSQQLTSNSDSGFSSVGRVVDEYAEKVKAVVGTVLKKKKGKYEELEAKIQTLSDDHAKAIHETQEQIEQLQGQIQTLSEIIDAEKAGLNPPFKGRLNKLVEKIGPLQGVDWKDSELHNIDWQLVTGGEKDLHDQRPDVAHAFTSNRIEFLQGISNLSPDRKQALLKLFDTLQEDLQAKKDNFSTAFRLWNSLSGGVQIEGFEVPLRRCFFSSLFEKNPVCSFNVYILFFFVQDT